MHLSKIFSFLSPGSYSRLGINFFRFPFGFLGERESDPQKFKRLLERAQQLIDSSYEPDFRRNKIPILDHMQHVYNELKNISDPDEEVQRTLNTLLEILNNNHRYPKQ